MPAAYDAQGNVNPAFASDINNWIMAMAIAQLTGVQNAIAAASAQISTDGVTGIASAATTP